MASVQLAGDHLLVALTAREKVAGLLRDVRVPMAAIRSVSVERDALAAARGVRAPGLAIPGRVKVGTWRGRGGRRLVVARRGVPALSVELRGAGYEQLLVSTPDAAELAARIEAARGEAAG